MFSIRGGLYYKNEKILKKKIQNLQHNMPQAQGCGATGDGELFPRFLHLYLRGLKEELKYPFL